MTDEGRIVANTAYRVVAEVVSKLISIAFYIVLAREVGDASFGIFTFGLAFVALVTTLATFGQDAIVVREVSRRRSLVHDYFANTLALKTLLAVPVLVLAVAIATAAGMDSTTRLVILLLGVGVTAETLMATCFGVFQAFDRLGFIPVVLVLQRAAMTAVGIPVILAGGGVAAASAVYLGAALLALALAVAFLRRRVVRPRLRVEAGRWLPLMRTAAPVGFANVFSTTLFRIDTALLALLTTNAVVGDYGAAYRLFEATLFFTWSVSSVTYPLFSRLAAGEAALTFVKERALKLGLVPTVPLAVGALVLGGPVITLLYGNEFEEAGTALMLLAPAIALYPVEHVASAMLIAQDRQRIVAVVLGAVAAANVALNLVLIPLFSLNGAAAATSLSELGLTAAFLIFARRLTGPLDWLRVASGPALGGLAAGVVMLVLRDHVLVAVAAGALAYVLVLALWERRRFPEDARAVSDFILRRA